MTNRRKHHKVQDLPDELMATVNEKLVDGYTYQEIADFLKELGHPVGKSSVGRYGKDFLSRLERLKIVKEQAKTIVNNSADAPATEMAEAANQLAMQLIMEALMQVENLEGAKITSIMQSLAKLETSGVRREALKLNFNRGVEAAIEKIKAGLKEELGANPELMNKLAAMVDGQAEALRR